MLSVIESVKKETPDYFEIHTNGLIGAIQKYKLTNAREDLHKLVYHGIKAVAHHSPVSDPDGAAIAFKFIEMIKGHIALLTPNELMRIFPIRKTYDGAKWGAKDYFSAMEALKAHGLDTPFGEKNDDLLWDYWNLTICMFQTKLLSCIGAIYKAETGTSMPDEFFDEMGITTHTMTTDSKTGKTFLTNNTTGEINRVFKAKPRHLNILPGGEPQ